MIVKDLFFCKLLCKTTNFNLLNKIIVLIFNLKGVIMKRKKPNKLKFRKIYILFFALLTLIFLIFLKIADIIPNLYFIIILIFLIVLFLFIYLLLKKKKKIGYLLSIFMIIIYLIITYYLGITMNFFSSFTDIHYAEKNYLVIVLNDDRYNKIEDLNNKNVGYITNNEETLDKALNKLGQKISIETIEHNDYITLFNDLDNQILESIFIEESYYNIKKEEEEVTNYKILDVIKVRTITKNDSTKSVDITKDPFTIYISGIDTYGNIETVSRSDVNILMTINPLTKQVLLTSIPRDYYVQLSGTTGYKDKLTHAGNYGINMSIETIEDLLDININYYIRVNFSTLEKLIDALDGVDVYSTYSFISYIDNYKFYQGYNHMNGKQALAFSRERKSLPNGDIDRGKNQEAVIEAIIRKVTSSDIIYKYTKILNTLKGTFQTNLSDTDITRMIKKELENIGGWNITSISLKGSAEYNYTYSYSSQKLYVLIPDQNSISNALSMIKSIIKGDKLESSYDNNPNDIKVPSQVNPAPLPEPETENTESSSNDNESIQEEVKENNDNNNPLDDLLPEIEDEDDDKKNNNEENNSDNLEDLLPTNDNNE